MPSEILAKETKCTVKLQGGTEVELTLRPFTLADLAWLQDEFNTPESRNDLAGMKVDPICKVIWRILTSSSKSLFSDIKFMDFDEEEEEEFERKILGYEKLKFSLDSEKEMMDLFSSYCDNEGLNNFVPTNKKKVKS